MEFIFGMLTFSYCVLASMTEFLYSWVGAMLLIKGICKEKRLDFFKLLEDVSPLIREASSVLRAIGGESQILSPMGVTPRGSGIPY